MRLLLFRLWPALIPLLVYWLWLRVVGRKATIEGRPVLRFADGPWYWAVLASLLTGLICFVVLGASLKPDRGEYIPPRLEGGKIIPAQVEHTP